MSDDYLSEPQADRLAELLRSQSSLKDGAEIYTDMNPNRLGFQVFVITRIRESRLRGRTPAEQREMEDAAISTARALARRVFAETIRRKPREDEIIVAKFAKHVLDCRIKI
jgi:hypothetical protein